LKGFVLDSYAMIAYLEDEPGAERVERILRQAERGTIDLLMSVINWGEVYYSLSRSKGEKQAEESLLIMEQLPIRIVDVDRSLMYQAARIKANHAIALGDSLAAALAMNEGCPVVTGDKEFHQLKEAVKVEWLKR